MWRPLVGPPIGPGPGSCPRHGSGSGFRPGPGPASGHVPGESVWKVTGSIRV